MTDDEDVPGKFPVLVVVMAAGILILTTISGAFMYATGEEVVESVSMQMVSHTEYRFSEQGQVVARLTNYQGDPIAVDNCTASVLYPNKTYFFQDNVMNSSSINGDHYIEFTTPSGPEGVYEYQATCYYQQGGNTENASVTNSFHLSGSFNRIQNNFTTTFNNQQDINTTANDILAVVDNVNATTTDTYQYVTGTLATNVDSILTTVGVINQTVNEIQTTTENVNSTVNQIQQNQEDRVNMRVFSG